MKYAQKIRLWQSGRGRAYGWDVELDGKQIAVLSRPREEDMFWVSYEVAPTTEDRFVATTVLGRAFWLLEGSRLVYRSRVARSVTVASVVSGKGDVGPGSVAFRGLYADVRGPRVWDRWVLMLCRFMAFLRDRS